MSGDELKCSHCSVAGYIGGPEAKRMAFLESQGWRMVGGKLVCPYCTGIGWQRLQQAAEDGTIDLGSDP